MEQLDKQLGEERDRRAQLEQELSKRGEQTDERSTRPAVIALFLSPGGIRGGGETKRLVLAPGVEQVRLRFELTGDASNRYRAVFDADGKEGSSRRSPDASRAAAESLADPFARLLAEERLRLKRLALT